MKNGVEPLQNDKQISYTGSKLVISKNVDAVTKVGQIETGSKVTEDLAASEMRTAGLTPCNRFSTALPTWGQNT